jgi:hypothetical protein
MATLRDYYGDFAQSLRSDFAVIVRLQNSLMVGLQNESVIRSFLREHLPDWFGVETGFVLPYADFEEKIDYSRQVDIIIYDRMRYAPVHSVDGFVLVREEAVAATIEVKTTMRQQDLIAALENIRSTKAINRGIYGYVFAFSTSLRDTTIQRRLQAFEQHHSFRELPDAICVLDGQFIARNQAEMKKVEARGDQLAMFHYKMLYDLANWLNMPDVAEYYREVGQRSHQVLLEVENENDLV